MPRSIKQTSLADQVAEAVIEMIQERRLEAGDQLPSSSDLAETFGVSVPVVREALAGLAAIGLLRRHQGRESTVARPNSTHLSRLFALRTSGTIDDEKLQQFREIVEVGNARLAARNRTPDQLLALEDAMSVLAAATSAEALHDADVRFHAAIAAAADNDFCELTLASIEPLLRRLRRRVWNGWVAAGGNFVPIIEAHRLILEAIIEGDEDAAGSAMNEHLAQARAGLLQSIRAGDPHVEPRAGFVVVDRESGDPVA